MARGRYDSPGGARVPTSLQMKAATCVVAPKASPGQPVVSASREPTRVQSGASKHSYRAFRSSVPASIILPMTFTPWTFITVAVAGWLNRQQQEVIARLPEGRPKPLAAPRA